MIYQVLLTEEAKNDLDELGFIERKKVFKAIDIIEHVDIMAVKTRPLTNKLFEIKTDNVRSIFAYSKDKIIIIGLIFVKKTQKTPIKFIDKANRILKEYM
ncbi:MAG: type II toxin-antitoxin system RelE/ParE family toxin [Candidatus Gastranaerophilales bacterium]|nr:type II toxin-antitoxin system RelE/ParE family toxin [Candidatus Gastranaerophilales bacterium]